MQPAILRELLKIDWASFENTPERERQPARLQRWHLRAQRLATLEGRPFAAVSEELKEAAMPLAAHQRRHHLSELARDLAVSRALGQGPPPPWRRRLQRLVEVSGEPAERMRRRVEGLAARVRVVIQSDREPG